jgi:hypothetical protein
VNLGSAKTDLFYERKKYGFKKRWTMWIFSGCFGLILCCGIRTRLFLLWQRHCICAMIWYWCKNAPVIWSVITSTPLLLYGQTLDCLCRMRLIYEFVDLR